MPDGTGDPRHNLHVGPVVSWPLHEATLQCRGDTGIPSEPRGDRRLWTLEAPCASASRPSAERTARGSMPSSPKPVQADRSSGPIIPVGAARAGPSTEQAGGEGRKGIAFRERSTRNYRLQPRRLQEFPLWRFARKYFLNRPVTHDSAWIAGSSPSSPSALATTTATMASPVTFTTVRHMSRTRSRLVA